MNKPRSPDPIDKHIGTRIRMRRNELGISQEKLADALGLSYQQLQKYEKAVNRVCVSRLSQIATVLEVDIDFFYQGAPGSNGKNGAHRAPAVMDEFISSKDGLHIANAFVRIKDPLVRHRVASSIAALVGEMTS